MRVDKHPGFPGLIRISAPKGHKANRPNLIVCNPKGIPMMVINKKKLAIKYSSAINTPPFSSGMHRIFTCFLLFL